MGVMFPLTLSLSKGRHKPVVPAKAGTSMGREDKDVGAVPARPVLVEGRETP